MGTGESGTEFTPDVFIVTASMGDRDRAFLHDGPGPARGTGPRAADAGVAHRARSCCANPE
jgi:hypothetical protein